MCVNEIFEGRENIEISSVVGKTVQVL